MTRIVIAALVVMAVTVLNTPAEAWLSGEVNDALHGRNHTSSPGSILSSIVGIGFIGFIVYSWLKKDDDE